MMMETEMAVIEKSFNHKEYCDRASKVFSPISMMKHVIFLGIKEYQKVIESTPIGSRLAVAKYPNFYKLYLYSYHSPGEPSYPRGGVKVWNETDRQMQSFYLESVAIHPHPNGGMKKFRDPVEIDVDNLDVVSEDIEESNKEAPKKRKRLVNRK